MSERLLRLVVNTSPLIHLAEASLLHLLRETAPTVWVPEPVAREIRAYGNLDPTARALATQSWLEVQQVPALSAKSWLGTWGPGKPRYWNWPGHFREVRWSSTTWRDAAEPRHWGYHCAARSAWSSRPSKPVVSLPPARFWSPCATVGCICPMRCCNGRGGEWGNSPPGCKSAW